MTPEERAENIIADAPTYLALRRAIAFAIREAVADAYSKGYQNGESSMIADYYMAFDASDAPELASIGAEPHGGPSELVALVLKAIHVAVSAEREACAKVADDFWVNQYDDTTCTAIAAAIRKRGET